jgi:hypothetical protein
MEACGMIWNEYNEDIVFKKHSLNTLTNALKIC